MVDETLMTYSEDRMRETAVDKGNTKMITVLHVFEGIIRRPDFDFLTNMGTMDETAQRPKFGANLPPPQPELLKPVDSSAFKRKKKKPKLVETKDEPSHDPATNLI